MNSSVFPDELVCVCFWGNILSERSFSPDRSELWSNVDEQAGRAARDQLIDGPIDREGVRSVELEQTGGPERTTAGVLLVSGV